ncbi:MAG TPA: dienelactone hydrolase family protein [Thermoanaerobaculia bacterium]|nr:dienelactone hydrolase family protein [Thermoanaerobaculia bacterium]
MKLTALASGMTQRAEFRSQSVRFEPTRLGSAPALLAWPAGEILAPLPAVLWLHGFTADKETHRPELGALAKAGFLGVGIDAVGHGERRFADFEARFDQAQNATDDAFLDLVETSAREIPEIRAALATLPEVAPEQISIAGISMGAYTLYDALTSLDGFAAAVALLGSPRWPRASSPHHSLARFFPTALFSLTAGQDEVVAPEGARRFHEDLAPYYAARPERLKYREIEGASHLMSPIDWALAVRETIAWLIRFGKV